MTNITTATIAQAFVNQSAEQAEYSDYMVMHEITNTGYLTASGDDSTDGYFVETKIVVEKVHASKAFMLSMMADVATPETELFETDTPDWLMDNDIFCLFELGLDIIAIKDTGENSNKADIFYLFKGEDVYQVGITWTRLGDTSFTSNRDEDNVRMMVKYNLNRFGGEAIETHIGDSFVIYHTFTNEHGLNVGWSSSSELCSWRSVIIDKAENAVNAIAMNMADDQVEYRTRK